MTRYCIAATLCFIYLASDVFGQTKSGGYVPVKGFVPDGITAVKIAEAVLIPIL
jgi:hypothetical protein